MGNKATRTLYKESTGKSINIKRKIISTLQDSFKMKSNQAVFLPFEDAAKVELIHLQTQSDLSDPVKNFSRFWSMFPKINYEIKRILNALEMNAVQEAFRSHRLTKEEKLNLEKKHKLAVELLTQGEDVCLVEGTSFIVNPKMFLSCYVYIHLHQVLVEEQEEYLKTVNNYNISVQQVENLETCPAQDILNYLNELSEKVPKSYGNSKFCEMFKIDYDSMNPSQKELQLVFDDIIENLDQESLVRLITQILKRMKDHVQSHATIVALNNLISFVREDSSFIQLSEECSDFADILCELIQSYNILSMDTRSKIDQFMKEMEESGYIEDPEEETFEYLVKNACGEDEFERMLQIGLLDQDTFDFLKEREFEVRGVVHVSNEFGFVTLDKENYADFVDKDLYTLKELLKVTQEVTTTPEVNRFTSSEGNGEETNDHCEQKLNIEVSNLIRQRGTVQDSVPEQNVIQCVKTLSRAVELKEITLDQAVITLNKYVHGNQATEFTLVDFEGMTHSPLIARDLDIKPAFSTENVQSPIDITEFTGDVLPTFDGMNLSYFSYQTAQSAKDKVDAFEIERTMVAQAERFEENWKKTSNAVRVTTMMDLSESFATKVEDSNEGNSDLNSRLHRTFTDTELANRIIINSLVLQTVADVENMRLTRQAASKAKSIVEDQIRDKSKLEAIQENSVVRYFLANPNKIESALGQKRGNSFNVRYMPHTRTVNGKEQRIGCFAMIPKRSQSLSSLRYKYRIFIEERDTSSDKWRCIYMSRLMISSKGKLEKMYRDNTSILNLQTIIPRYTTTNLLLQNYMTNPCDSMESWYGCSHFVRSNDTNEDKLISLKNFLKARKMNVFTTGQQEQHILAFETSFEDISLYNFIQTLMVPVERNDKMEFTADAMETYLKEFRGEDTFDKEVLAKFFQKLSDPNWLGTKINMEAVRKELQNLTEIPLDSILGSTSSNSITVKWSDKHGKYISMLAKPQSKKNIDAVLLCTKLQVEHLDFKHLALHMLYVPLIRMFVKNQLAAAREISINTPEAKIICATEELIAQCISKHTKGDLIMRELDKAKENRNLFIEFGCDPDVEPLVLELDGKKWNNCMDMGMFRAVSTTILHTIFGYDTKAAYFMDMVFAYYKHKALEIPLKKFPVDSLLIMKEVFSTEEILENFSIPDNYKAYVKGEVNCKKRLNGVLYSAILEYLQQLKGKIAELREISKGEKISFNELVVAVDAPTGMGQGIFSAFSSLFGSLVLSFIEEELFAITGVKYAHSQTSDDMLIIGKHSKKMTDKEVLAFFVHMASCFNIRMSVQKCSHKNKPECMFNSCAYDFRECYWFKYAEKHGIKDPHLQKKSVYVNHKPQNGTKGKVEDKYIIEYFDLREKRFCRAVDCKLPTFSRLLKGSFGMNLMSPVEQRLSYISSITDFFGYFPYSPSSMEKIVSGNRKCLNIAMANHFIYSDHIDPLSDSFRYSQAISDPVPFVKYKNESGEFCTYLTASTEVLLLLSMNADCESVYGKLDPSQMGNVLEESDTPIGFKMKHHKMHTFEKQSRQQQVLGGMQSTGSIGLASKYIRSLSDTEEGVDTVVQLIKRYRGAYIPTRVGQLEQPFFRKNEIKMNQVSQNIINFKFGDNKNQPYGYLAFVPEDRKPEQVPYSRLVSRSLMNGNLNQNPDSLLDLVVATDSHLVFDDTRDMDLIVQIVPPIKEAYAGVRNRPKICEALIDYLNRIGGQSPHDIYVVAQQRAGPATWKGIGLIAQNMDGIWTYSVVDDNSILMMLQSKEDKWKIITNKESIESLKKGAFSTFDVSVNVRAATDFLFDCTFDGTCWQYFRSKIRKVPLTRRKDLNALLNNDPNTAFGLAYLSQMIEEHTARMAVKHFQDRFAGSILSLANNF